MRLAAIFTTTVLLTGCMTPTEYRPMYSQGGYDDTRLNQTTYNVVATVNDYTYDKIAMDYALTRAAELACENRYRYFQVEDRAFDSTQSMSRLDRRKTVYMRIKMLEYPDRDGNYYDAESILKKYWGTYKTIQDAVTCRY